MTKGAIIMPKMRTYVLTVGLNDRKTKKQKFSITEARAKLTRTLLNHYGIYAFTMWECAGCYKHENGEIVQEVSLRLEIAVENPDDEKILALCKTIKHKRMFNQESIMIDISDRNIGFNTIK